MRSRALGVWGLATCRTIVVIVWPLAIFAARQDSPAAKAPPVGLQGQCADRS